MGQSKGGSIDLKDINVLRYSEHNKHRFSLVMDFKPDIFYFGAKRNHALVKCTHTYACWKMKSFALPFEWYILIVSDNECKNITLNTLHPQQKQIRMRALYLYKCLCLFLLCHYKIWGKGAIKYKFTLLRAQLPSHFSKCAPCIVLIGRSSILKRRRAGHNLLYKWQTNNKSL